MRLQLLTTKQVAEELQVSERRVLELIHRGDLAASNVGGEGRGGKRWRVRPQDLDKFLEVRKLDAP